MDTVRYLHALCAIRPRMTPVRLWKLARMAGNAEAAWKADDAVLREAGWNEEAIAVFAHHRQTWDVPGEAERLQRSGMELVPLEDRRTPALLKEIYDPPVALYVRGELRQGALCVAVVGSRQATPYGRTATQALVRPLAARGLTIVSGLAYGIDAEAHRAALAVHGRTVAVLGSGMDDASLYPRAHRDLANEIVTAGGAILSEYPPGTPARPEYFPQRNRIIAGLSRAVIVAEAARDSGALITARAALSENREVFAVPGPITSPLSEGVNHLLKEGAAPAISAEDIVEALALEDALPVPAPLSPPSEPTSARILSSLSREPRTIDTICAVTKLPAQDVSAAVSILELDGVIRDVGGKHYVRTSA